MIRLFGVVLCTCAVLLALEGATRLFRPQKYFSICVAAWDKDTGARNIPGIKGLIICPEYKIDMIINSKGLRDREFEYEKPAGTRRILCLGDSYTFGYGVQADETFAKLLERSLNEEHTGGSRWEVLNAGVRSTGTAHQLALFQTECYKYAPDIVVVCFCPANDFWDNVISGLYTLDHGALVKHEAPSTAPRRIQQIIRFLPGYTTFVAKSHLLNLVRNRAATLDYNMLYKRSAKLLNNTDVVQAQNDLTDRLIDALDEACMKRGARLVVMVIPPPKVDSVPLWTAKFREHCTGRGIPCLDLGPTFEAAAVNNTQTSYPVDGHWNARGHALAARALHDFLVARGTVSTAAPVQGR